MATLPEELGADYLDQFYRHSFFKLDDRIYTYMGHLSAQDISVRYIDSTAKGKPKWTPAELKSSVLTNMDVFGWPKLGYRNYTLAQMKIPVYITCQRSAMRGLKDEFLNFNSASVSQLIPNLQGNVRDYLDSAGYVKEIFAPDFPVFHDALNQIKNTEAVGVALSPDIALVLSSSPDYKDAIEVVFREKTIGYVTEGQEVVIPHKYAKRASTAKLFGGYLR